MVMRNEQCSQAPNTLLTQIQCTQILMTIMSEAIPTGGSVLSIVQAFRFYGGQFCTCMYADNANDDTLVTNTHPAAV